LEIENGRVWLLDGDSSKPSTNGNYLIRDDLYNAVRLDKWNRTEITIGSVIGFGGPNYWAGHIPNPFKFKLERKEKSTYFS